MACEELRSLIEISSENRKKKLSVTYPYILLDTPLVTERTR